MSTTTREWHRVEFHAPGQRPRVAAQITGADGSPQTIEVDGEYHPKEVLGYGYYVVEEEKDDNGAVIRREVVAHVDEQNQPLDMERIHECRLVSIHKSSPFASPSA